MSITKEQTEQLLEDWLDRLENGNYKQGQGQLRSCRDEYCCLGLLNNIVIERAWIPIQIHEPNHSTDRYLYEFGNSCAGGYIPESIVKYIGLSTGSGKYLLNNGMMGYLSYANDDQRLSFKQIAKIIRNHKEELFPILKDKTNAAV